MDLVEIKERLRGTKGGEYYYVREDKILRSIRKYSREEKIKDKELLVKVDKDKLMGKDIYEFSFSRKGSFWCHKVKIEDLKNGTLPMDKEWCNFDKMWADGIRFESQDSELKYYAEKLFPKIIGQLRNYAEELNFDFRIEKSASQIGRALKDYVKYYYSFMALPEDKSRLGSLTKTRNHLFQLWTVMRVCKMNDFFVEEFIPFIEEEKPCWRIGEEWADTAPPLCIGKTKEGYITFWHEISFAFLRPDIIITKGKYNKFSEVQENPSIAILIECKTDPPDKWNIEKTKQQLRGYKEIGPMYVMLFSLYPMWENIKIKFKNLGVRVVDNLLIEIMDSS